MSAVCAQFAATTSFSKDAEVIQLFRIIRCFLPKTSKMANKANKLLRQYAPQHCQQSRFDFTDN
jgi:hypothetical protein